MNKISISLIVPCYNEEINIQKGVLDTVGNYTAADRRFIEVLIVDDGSEDSSKNLIKKKYLSKFKKFRLIENSHKGKAYAVMTGIQRAKGTHVLFTDIDLATPIDEAEKLIAQVKGGHQVVIGSRTKREGAPLLRKVMAFGGIIIREVVIGIKGIHDTQCGFKLFEKKAAQTIIQKLQVFHNNKTVHGSSVSAGFDMEFLFLATRLGYKIKEVPVVWKHVETKNVNFLKDSIETLWDITKIKYNSLSGKYS